MVEAMLRRSRRREAGRLAAAAGRYAELGWPVCAGAPLREESGGPRLGGTSPRRWARDTGRACSCDRIGCPAPGAHPISPAWQMEASADPAEVRRWWQERPDANVILVTGRVFDVIDVPAGAGALALERVARDHVRVGPVAMADGRALFFVATRGAAGEEEEWWSCHLDCEPDTVPPVSGLRWHTRNSYVLAPPSRSGQGRAAYWLRDPDRAIPDPLRLLGYLADACDEVTR